MRWTISLAFAVAILAHSALAAPMTCRAAQMHSCTKDGCEAKPTAAFSRADIATGTYERCDSKGCDRYEVKYQTAGVFITAIIAPGAFFKKEAAGSGFLEVVTLGTQVFIYAGDCKP